MKKFIASIAAAAALIAGAANADVALEQEALDTVTAGSVPVVGGAQIYSITFVGGIVNLPVIKDNTAGAGATADALGFYTLTDAKTQTFTTTPTFHTPGQSSSAAGSLSVSALPPCGFCW